MSFMVDIGNLEVDSDRYSVHTFSGEFNAVDRSEVVCNECPEDTSYVWGGEGVPFTQVIKAVVRHELSYHAQTQQKKR